MSGIFKVPKGVTTVTVGPILGGSGGSGGSGAGNFVLGGGGGSIGATKIPAHLIVDSSIGGYPLSASNTFQNFVDHTITGQTLFVEHVVPASAIVGSHIREHMKTILIEKLLQEIVKGKYVEFTQMEKYETNEMVFRARIHVVPDTQVRIIREIKDARKTA